jgi:hypothetical protein
VRNGVRPARGAALCKRLFPTAPTIVELGIWLLDRLSSSSSSSINRGLEDPGTLAPKGRGMGRHLLLNGWAPLFAVLAIYEGWEGRLSWVWAIVVCVLAVAVVFKAARITVLEANVAQSRPANAEAERTRLEQGARDRNMS